MEPTLPPPQATTMEAPIPRAPASPHSDKATGRFAALRRKTWAWLRLPHLLPVIFVLLTTLACALLIPGDPPRALSVAFVLLAMLGGQLAIGAVNELVDVELDRQTKPTKPIPAGDISVAAAQRLVVVSLLLMVGFSAALGWVSLVLCLVGTGAGLAYNLVFKRTLWSWLPYLIALPLLPIWVWTSLGRFDERLLWLYPLGAPAVLGVHIAQSLPDIAGDTQAGLDHISSRLGERRALALCWATMIAAPALALVVGPLMGADLAPIVLGASAAVVLVMANIAIVGWRKEAGIAACFPCVAASTAIVAVCWILAVR